MKTLDEIIKNTPIEWDDLRPKLNEWAKSIATQYASSSSSGRELLIAFTTWLHERDFTDDSTSIEDWVNTFLSSTPDLSTDSVVSEGEKREKKIRRSSNATAYNDGYSRGYADALDDVRANKV
jgi:hypothetical protein